MKTINLFGASGHAKVVMDILTATGCRVARLYDDNPHSQELCGCTVLKTPEHTPEGPLIISIGSNCMRKSVASRYPLSYATAVHPSAVVSPTAHVGEGTVVMQGAIVQAEATIGRHCIINTGASVDHECRIGDYVHVSPHATLCGNVAVGEGTWIGAGAIVLQGVSIGRWCVIGAGSVVLHDIPDNATAYGNPCREKR